MPLTITIPEQEFFNSRSGRFIVTKKTTLTLEHSLISISKWESKWHKPYLSKENKTTEESLDYLRCMCITPNVDPNVFLALDEKKAKLIADYISDPMTATTFKRRETKPNRQIVTSELVYYWMTEFGIPFDPCEKWHFNRLMTLIEVASIKQSPPKKMGKREAASREAASQRAALNAQRRARYNSRG